MTISTGWKANLLLSLAASLFSILLLEQGFRCLLFGWSAFDREGLRNNVPINHAGILQPSPFNDIYWDMKPDLNMSFKFARFSTNQYGLPDKEYSLKKDPSTYRIAVLGDSFSMASGVDIDKSYHALTEQWLNRDYPTRHYEIINFSVGGFNLQRYNAVLQHKVPDWHPDAILLGYCGHNDHIAIDPDNNLRPHFAPREDGFWHFYVYAYLSQWYRDWVSTSGQPTPALYSSPVELSESDLAYIDQQLGQMRILANGIKTHMPIVLVFLDNRSHRPQDIQNLQLIAKHYDISFVDTSAQFADKPLKDYSLHLLDSHPNAKADKLFADTLYGAIQQHGWFETGGGVVMSPTQ